MRFSHRQGRIFHVPTQGVAKKNYASFFLTIHMPLAEGKRGICYTVGRKKETSSQPWDPARGRVVQYVFRSIMFVMLIIKIIMFTAYPFPCAARRNIRKTGIQERIRSCIFHFQNGQGSLSVGVSLSWKRAPSIVFP